MNKKILTLLVLVCAAFSCNATGRNSQPVHVIAAIDELLNHADDVSVIQHEVLNNKQSGLVEASVLNRKFRLNSDNMHYLDALVDAFNVDVDCAYQFHTIDGNSRELLTVNSLNGVDIIHEPGELTWMISVKNPKNPRLRDVYALVFKQKSYGGVTEGRIYENTYMRFETDDTRSKSNNNTSYSPNSNQTVSGNNVAENPQLAGMKEAIELYSDYINKLKQDIKIYSDTRSYQYNKKMADALNKKLEETYTKMQRLVDKYAEELVK